MNEPLDSERKFRPMTDQCEDSTNRRRRYAAKKLCEMCEALVAPDSCGDCPQCGAGLQRVPIDLMDALREALPKQKQR